MPYYKRRRFSRRRPRRRFKRRFRSRRSNTSVRKRPRKLPSNTTSGGFPTHMKTKLLLRTSFTHTSSNPANRVVNYVTLNNLYDTWRAGAGAVQPQFYDEFAKIYQRYKVSSVGIKVRYIPLPLTGTPAGGCHVVHLFNCGPNNSTWNSIGSDDNRTLAPYTTRVDTVPYDQTLGQPLRGGFSRKFYYQMGKFFTDQDFRQERFSAEMDKPPSSGTPAVLNPAEQVNFYVTTLQHGATAIGTGAGSDFLGRYEITLAYYVTFYEPKSDAYNMDTL